MNLKMQAEIVALKANQLVMAGQLAQPVGLTGKLTAGAVASPVTLNFDSAGRLISAHDDGMGFVNHLSDFAVERWNSPSGTTSDPIGTPESTIETDLEHPGLPVHPVLVTPVQPVPVTPVSRDHEHGATAPALRY